MTTNKLFFLFLFLVCQCVLAQDTIITVLEDVVVSDVNLKKYSVSQKTQVFSDSTLQINKPSLTSLLQYNTLLYFKENGLGMVSSPSFRGTTAQQTAVVWNGININSQLNGQTDFNTIGTRNFSSVSVRSGGGSVIYGSGAIGGTIHLQNDLRFDSKIKNQIQLDYGSFNTIGVSFNSEISTPKIASTIGYSRNSSENDYKFLKTTQKNENGQYHNNNLNIAFGYKLNSNNYIKLYSQLYDGERHFSAALGSFSKSKYQNLDTRNLLEWKSLFNQFTTTLRIGQLQEEYRYFEDKANENFSFGKAQTSLAKYDLAFNLNSKFNINTIIEYAQTKGSGSDLKSETRKIGSASVLLKHSPITWFEYEFTAKKEITDQYKSPFLFSLGSVLMPFSFYKIKLNGSRNFRFPSFNDLYWKGLGNPNLKPEYSYQLEVGQEFKYKKTTLNITGYGIKMTNLIQWKPGIGNVWSPENVFKVRTIGAEVEIKTHEKIRNHLLELITSYGFVKSINENTKKELIYVPNHKFTGNISYKYKRLSINNQVSYNGVVFTSSDNANILPDYLLYNAGIYLRFAKKQNLKLGVQTHNILNEKYQSVLGRPFPGRNYSLNLNLNF